VPRIRQTERPSAPGESGATRGRSLCDLVMHLLWHRSSLVFMDEERCPGPVRGRSGAHCQRRTSQGLRVESLTGREASTATSPLHPTNQRCCFHASHESAHTARISCRVSFYEAL